MTKRPLAAPILDSIVCEALGSVTNHWEALAHALADGDRRARIEAAMPEGCDISILRAVDVTVWMTQKHSNGDDPPLA